MELRELAARLGCEVNGDSSLDITGVAGMEHAGPNQITFLANPKYASKVKHCRAGAILVSRPLTDLPIVSVVSANPYLDFARALAFFYHRRNRRPEFIPLPSCTADGASSARMRPSDHSRASASGPIGRNAVLHPHVVIYEGRTNRRRFPRPSHAVGARVLPHRQSRDPAERRRRRRRRFGFAKRADGRTYKIVQSGVTVIEDDVEIQTLTSVDRATVGETRVKRGAKIDSLVQIGHACVVGEDNIICAQTGLAGSTILERNVLLAGQVGISGHLTIHENAVVYAQSGVGGDVAAGAASRARPHSRRASGCAPSRPFPKLPELLKTDARIEEEGRRTGSSMPEQVRTNHRRIVTRRARLRTRTRSS